MLKLNLGCGHDIRQGYVNIDVKSIKGVDLILDISKDKLPFDDGSIDEILLKDVLEHVSYTRVEHVLRECYRVLKPGGQMYIQCPDMEAIAQKIILSGEYDWRAISYWVYGDQNLTQGEDPSDIHKSGFTIPTLKALLESIGFTVESIKNDGGTNINCWVKKPQTEG